LRQKSARDLTAIGFDGYAIGGLAVGEPQDVMFDMIARTAPLLPTDRPRYLMGVGTPLDILGAVARGIDMFDCVMPTRAGRTAQAFTRRGTLNLRNAKFRDDAGPLDDECGCPACRGAALSRAYIHHLIKCGEILGATLLTRHNLWFYQDLMRDIRAAIEQSAFADFAAKFIAKYTGQK
jgi:queuine tRNA-ribosyltransferase